MIYQEKLVIHPVCYIAMFVNDKRVCDLHSYEQIIITKKLQSYVVNTNGISLYCDKIYIEGNYFTENQIILNFGAFDDIKSVNEGMELN